MPASSRWSQLLLAVPLLGTVTATCWSQVDLLTIRESARLLETFPQYKRSQSLGQCPGFDLSSDAPSKVWIQMRGFCPPEGFNGSTTIASYYLDRSTGTVTVWPSGEGVNVSAEAKSLARILVAQARARTLSEHEAQCVAREAGRDGSGLYATEVAVSEERNESHRIQYLVRYRVPSWDIRGAWHISLDTSTFEVTGPFDEGIHSLRIGALLAKMRALREPIELSSGDAVAVALQVPSLRVRVRSMCGPELSAEFGSADTRYITLRDTCATLPRQDHVVAAVNILNGAVTDPKTGVSLDSPESLGLARDLLEVAQGRGTALRAEIDTLCR